MVQLMPLPFTVSCFSKIQISFSFLVPAHPSSPGKTAVKRVYVCMYLLSILATTGNSDAAHQRLEDVILLGITALAGLTFLPLASTEPRDNLTLKTATAQTFGSVLCDNTTSRGSAANVTADYLMLLGHPRTCATVLKVAIMLYSM